jgi:hypothetical protein
VAAGVPDAFGTVAAADGDGVEELTEDIGLGLAAVSSQPLRPGPSKPAATNAATTCVTRARDPPTCIPLTPEHRDKPGTAPAT